MAELEHAKCQDCGRQMEPGELLELKHQVPGGVLVDGVREAKQIEVCSGCNDKAREAVIAAELPDSQPNGEQT